MNCQRNKPSVTAGGLTAKTDSAAMGEHRSGIRFGCNMRLRKADGALVLPPASPCCNKLQLRRKSSRPQAPRRALLPQLGLSVFLRHPCKTAITTQLQWPQPTHQGQAESICRYVAKLNLRHRLYAPAGWTRATCGAASSQFITGWCARDTDAGDTHGARDQRQPSHPAQQQQAPGTR